ncbi:hypothetical protein NW807_01350 [Synechococcus sp. R70.1]|uniref:hypothetical protein n=1 Tax=Synechococcus sp. R70.1 TaxID=2964531 RepID=UPI0039C2F923
MSPQSLPHAAASLGERRSLHLLTLTLPKAEAAQAVKVQGGATAPEAGTVESQPA